MSMANVCNLKTEIFNEALLRAVKNNISDVPKEMNELEDEFGNITFRNVMHEMIRQEVQGIMLEKYFLKYGDMDKAQPEYDKWCDLASLDMYEDLWKWIDNACPFAIDDPDCVELFGFNDTNWNKI